MALSVWFVLGFAALAAVGIALGLAARARAAARGTGPASASPATALDDDAFMALLRAEATQGRAIVAIKLYRERTGVGLKDAKDAVDAIVAGRTLALGRAAPPPVAGLDDDAFAAQLALLIGADRKLEAIKLYRERTGAGLKEAKDAIEALAGAG